MGDICVKRGYLEVVYIKGAYIKREDIYKHCMYREGILLYTLPPYIEYVGLHPPHTPLINSLWAVISAMLFQHDTAAAAIATTAATPKSQELQPQARDNINSLKKTTITNPKQLIG